MFFFKNCHHLKPIRLADFTGSAMLQGACGSRLQRHPQRLATPADSTVAQFRFSKEIEVDYTPVKMDIT